MKEIITSVILLVLLVLLINPFHLWMTDTLQMMILLVLLVIFVIFAGLIWREDHRDERESLHKMLADRIGFLIGASVLVATIIIQGLKHDLDYWPMAVLVFMVLGKLIGLWYARLKN